MKRTHGGDWAGYETEYGHTPLDFSANVSPLGVPEGVRQAICRASAKAGRYPDPDCRVLRAAIAGHEGVSPDWALCGNGASDLIWRAVHAAQPKRALVTAPCFGEYEAALEESGCEVVRHFLGNDFALTDDCLYKIDHSIDFAILCNPNNPTGRTIEPALLRRIAARCEAVGCRLLLDECFIDFLDEPEKHTMRGELEAYPNLLILKAFTKLYGMAGVRLGYVMGADTAFLEQMRRAGPPWSVSQLAQEAGVAALQETNYVNHSRTLIAAQRPRLLAGLRDLGLRVVPGEANFLLFQSEAPLDEPLRKRGILIRNCADFVGLDDSWYRAAVRTREDNDMLLAALREIL